MDPLDDVVANVEVVGTLRHHPDLEGVAIPGRLEGLVPPARALEQRRPHRLGGATVEVVDDRLDRLADGGRRIPLLETVPPQESLGHRLAERRAVVIVAHRSVSGAGVVRARGVAVVGQLDERVMLAHRHRLRRRRHGPDRAAAEPRPAPTPVTREGQRRLELGVLRKPLGPR